MSQLGQGQPVVFDSPHSSWFFDRLNQHPRFAHHPLCSCYDHHVFRLGKHVLCLGCTSLVLGATVAVITLLSLFLTSELPSLFTRLSGAWALGVACYLPSLVQPFLQVKVIKVISRISLGFAIVILWYGTVFLLPWDLKAMGLRLVFLVVFWIVFKATNQFRRRFTPDPKATCDKGCYPFCGGNEERLDRLLQELKERAGPDDTFVGFAENLIATKNGEVVVPASD